MKKKINYGRIKEFGVMRECMTVQDAVSESSRCLLCEDAPCSHGCPAGTDPAKFVRQIRFQNYKGAARTIRNNNVLGAICAFTCPVEKLCEKECCSKLLNDPIDIAGLQRFACEYGDKFKLEPMEKGTGNKGKVAVVGAGPAGLSCAANLVKLGYFVTVYEKEDHAGGVPLWGVPAYRLPRATIDAAVSNLKNAGVSFVFGRKVEGKGALSELLSDGFNACFVSTGLSGSLNLDTFKGYKNVADAKEFLRSAKLGKKPELSDKIVAVIGGGSVAMDVAVTAKSLRAKKVYAISLEGPNELPADAEEIELARGVDVVFKTNSQIVDVAGSGDKLTSLKGMEIEWKEPNNFSPANARRIEGTEFNLNVDYVVEAIGSTASAEVKEFAEGLKYKGRGTIAVTDDFSTDISGVFAGGDISNGGATIVKAIGDGKAAAESIDKYISRRK